MGDYEPRVMLDTTANAVAEEEKQNAMMFFQMSSQLPFVDQVQLFKQTAEKMFRMDKKDLDTLIMQPMMPPIGPGMNPNAPMAMPPLPPGNPNDAV
jgi:hypothetical protein